MFSLLVFFVQAGGKLTVSFSEAPPLANAYDSLAEFSSKGPTKDGRVKPDVLAPGTLQSAYTDGSNTCSLRYGSACNTEETHLVSSADTFGRFDCCIQLQSPSSRCMSLGQWWSEPNAMSLPTVKPVPPSANTGTWRERRWRHR